MPEGRVPHFIGLGAQKAATSWIHACLYEHPQAFLPANKEIHYFSRHYDKGHEWYENHFRGKKAGQVVGEISPTYLYDPDSPPRIHAWNPQVKLLVCLRNPIDRAISAYAYGLKEGRDWKVGDVAELLRRKMKILNQGLYHEQLERYLNLFDQKQILITVYDDIEEAPLGFIRRIYQYLGLDSSFVPSSMEKRINPSLGAPKTRWFHRTMKLGANALRSAGFGGVVWRVSRSSFGEMLVRSNRRDATRPKLSPSDRSTLAQYFEDDVAALGRLLRRDMTKLWLAEHDSAAVDSP